MGGLETRKARDTVRSHRIVFKFRFGSNACSGAPSSRANGFQIERVYIDDGRPPGRSPFGPHDLVRTPPTLAPLGRRAWAECGGQSKRLAAYRRGAPIS